MIYELRRRARMRSIRIAVHKDGRVTVSAAKRVPLQVIERLLKEKQTWILRQQACLRSRPQLVPPSSKKDYLEQKDKALELAKERVEYFSNIYQLRPTAISIRNSRTRWGSCSRHGRISFSYRLIFLPSELRDYLVVHELCHLKEFNHSPRFWSLVAKAVPRYPALRKQLRLA